MTYNVDEIVDAVVLVIEKEIQEELSLFENIARLEIEHFDSVYLALIQLAEDNLLVKDLLIETANGYKKDQIYKKTKDKAKYIRYDEKKMYKGRLQLLQKDFDKYTIEELASLVRE